MKSRSFDFAQDDRVGVGSEGSGVVGFRENSRSLVASLARDDLPAVGSIHTEDVLAGYTSYKKPGHPE